MKINFHVGSVRLQCVYTAVYNSVWHNRTDLVSLVIGTLLCTDLFQNEINALCCSIWDLDWSQTMLFCFSEELLFLVLTSAVITLLHL